MYIYIYIYIIQLKLSQQVPTFQANRRGLLSWATLGLSPNGSGPKFHWDIDSVCLGCSGDRACHIMTNMSNMGLCEDCTIDFIAHKSSLSLYIPLQMAICGVYHGLPYFQTHMFHVNPDLQALLQGGFRLQGSLRTEVSFLASSQREPATLDSTSRMLGASARHSVFPNMCYVLSGVWVPGCPIPIFSCFTGWNWVYKPAGNWELTTFFRELAYTMIVTFNLQLYIQLFNNFVFTTNINQQYITIYTNTMINDNCIII